MRTLFFFLLFSPVFASLTIKDIKQQLDKGSSEEKLVPLLQKEGITFPINLNNLKKMKKAGFPDYIIDTVVELYGPHQSKHRTYAAAEVNDASVDHSTVHNPYCNNYPFSWYNPFYWYSSWYRYNFWNYSSIFPYFWGYGYGGYYWNYGYGYADTPGNRLTPSGFSNRHDGRVRGHATHRTKTKTKARRSFSGSSSSRRSHSGHSGSRSASSPRSSGSHAVRK